MKERLAREIATVNYYQRKYEAKFMPAMTTANETDLRDWSASAQEANKLAGIRIF